MFERLDKIKGIFRKKGEQQSKAPSRPAKAQPPELYQGLKTEYVLYIIFAVLILAAAIMLAKKLAMNSPSVQPVYTTKVLDDYLNDPEKLKTDYNKNYQKIPSILRFIFGDERINAVITRMDGTVVNIGAEMKGGLITRVNLSDIRDPTMIVQVSESAIKSIYESSDPIGELKNALDSKEISYKSNRFLTSVKDAVFGSMLTIASWFS